MEVVEDESIATASTSAPKFFGKPRMDHHHQRTVDTTMSSSSMLSVETHPPSRSNSNSNPFTFQPSSSDTVDSRHDSPKNGQEDPDAMMADTSSSGLVLPSSSMRLTKTTTTRVVTGESISNSTITRNNISTFGREEKVSLAPRFGKLETSSRDELEGAQGEHDLGNASMFSLSGSMSSEFLENQQHSDDHQQEYLHHPNRMGMNSPTSTTARDFLREVQCPPPLPTHSGERESRTSSFGSSSLPLHHRFGSANSSSATRPPFPPNGTAGLPSHGKASHPTLPREHTPNNASSPSPTNTIPGVGSFNCDRDKPVISRCFAWSQDSQDDRRITKRARTTPTGMTSSASSPLSNDGVMSPSSALETIRGSAASSIASVPVKSGEVPPANASANPNGSSSNHNHHSPPHSSPTKVHWEEKVEHSNELMSHAHVVDPKILFGINSAIQIATTTHHEDVAMTDEGQQETDDDRMPPPITTAQSASHYSFDSL